MCVCVCVYVCGCGWVCVWGEGGGYLMSKLSDDVNSS
jgi:hypothetical protein